MKTINSWWPSAIKIVSLTMFIKSEVKCSNTWTMERRKKVREGWRVDV
jgi:hypothetical protein